MSDLYIPPKEIFFRLLHVGGQSVLISRTDDTPAVTLFRQDLGNDNQLFQLIPGTGKHLGYYAIKNKVTGRVLFWRHAAKSTDTWGHIEGDGKYDDNWFQFKQGKGNFAGSFHLIGFVTKTLYFSFKNANSNDHYFSFLFEAMEFVRIDYHHDRQKKLPSTPIVIIGSTLPNRTSSVVTMSSEIDEKATQTSTFEHTTGFTVSAEFSFKVGVPVVGDVGVKLDTSHSQEWKVGETKEYSKSYKLTLSVPVAPHTSVRAVSTIKRGSIEIPYTMYLKSPDGCQVVSRGIYRGVKTWDITHELKETPLR